MPPWPAGRIDAERLRDLLVSSLPPADPLVFAVDVTTWPRCDAECSPERGYYYHPSRHSAGQPIIAGWAFQWIAQLGFDRDSWTAPVDARRLHPLDDTDQHRRRADPRAAGAAAGRRAGAAGSCSTPATTPPSCPWTSPRLPWRCWCGCAPTAASTPTRHQRRARPSTGRPRRHGAKFACADPATWPTPTATLACQDDQYGTVTVHAWSWAASQAAAPPRPRHPWAAADRARHHPPRPGRARPRPHPPAQGAVAVVGRPRRARPGSGPCLAGLCPPVRPGTHRPVLQADPGLDDPRPRHPAQADRWTWLVLAAYTQLRLARQVAGDQRLPWERPRPQPRLSPYRVRRGFPRLLCALGSPAAAPKPSGRSPGRPKGRRSGPAARYPAIKKPPRSPAGAHDREGRLTGQPTSTPADLGRRPARHARRVKSQA